MTTINKLGDDLLIEILIRSFPDPESACRRKLVCKRWSSLILSDPTFNRRFVSHHRSREISEPPPPLLVTPPPPPSTTSFHHRQYLSFLPVPDELWPYFAVLDTSNDLLLCGFLSAAGDMVFNRELMRSYLVCNPFTKQWVALPLVPEYWPPEVKARSLRGSLANPLTPLVLILEAAAAPPPTKEEEEGERSFILSSIVFAWCSCAKRGDGVGAVAMSDFTCFVPSLGVSTWDAPCKYVKTPMFERVVSCNGKLFGRKPPRG